LHLEDGLINTVFEHEEYSLLQMHFHWGFSEHEIVDENFVAELHLVHSSLLREGNYAVLGFLFKVYI
jgi:carbonic anhydrase